MLGRGVLGTLYTLSQQRIYTLTLYLDIDQNKQSNRRRGYVVQGEALIYANTAFAYAFGYRSPSELMEAGGLGAILPGGTGELGSARRRHRRRPALLDDEGFARWSGPLEAGDDLRRRLFENGAYFRAGLEARGFALVPGRHPIIPVMLGDAPLAVRFAAAMMAKDVRLYLDEVGTVGSANGLAAEVDTIWEKDRAGRDTLRDAIVVTGVRSGGAFHDAGFQKDDAILTDHHALGRLDRAFDLAFHADRPVA